VPTRAGKGNYQGLSLSANASARSIASAVNTKSVETGVTAEAVTNLKMNGLESTGSISFSLTGANIGTSNGVPVDDGDSAVTVAAVITDTNDLSTLVAAINENSGATGITARLDNEGSVIMTSSQGDDIFIEDFSFIADDGATQLDADFTTLDADEETPDGVTATTVTGADDGSVDIVAQGQVVFHSNAAYTIDTDGSTDLLEYARTSSGLEDVASIDINTQIGSGNALKVLDGAIAYLDSQRADLGAVMNRFESTIANLQNISENVSAARSRILDADIAQETSNMTKQNILQQAGVAILAQANQMPQLALSLLG
jgi:flagellin